MLAVERQQKILAIVRDRKSVSLEALSAELAVSGSTVRRDLEQLESTGEIERTHGGAVFVGGRDGAPRPYAFDARLQHNVDAKRRIARAARQLVLPGQTVLLDGGTTVYYFAEELRGLHVQIVTNSLAIAGLYDADGSAEVVLTGGIVYPRYGVLLGPLTEHAIGTLHTQTLFLSPAGLADGQLYNQNLLLVQTEEKMIRQSQQVVVLADSGKFGQQALSRLCALDEVDVLVTDLEPSSADRRRIDSAGCRLIIAT
jgi:DeoR/GlpR family transcriptional regulator of sugar metabolism